MNKLVSKKLKVIEENLSFCENLENVSIDLDKKTFKKIKKSAKKYGVSIEIYMNYLLREMVIDFMSKLDEQTIFDNITFSSLIKNNLNEYLDDTIIVDYITLNKFKLTKLDNIKE